MTDYIFRTSMHFRVDKRDPQDRIFMSVFCGNYPGSRPKVGELILKAGEFQTFFAALGLGAKSMMQKTDDGTLVPLEVTISNQGVALNRDDVPDREHFPVENPCPS
jgi:hypothetical protein